MDGSRKVTIFRRKRRRENGSGMSQNLLKAVAIIILAGMLINMSLLALGVGSAAGIYAAFAQDLPDPEQIQIAQEDFETTKIYDRTGEHLLYEVFDPRPHSGDRTYVPLEQIPLVMREATIALEDRSFYENPGINVRGLARAFWNNLQGLPIQGGSSITQQLVKHVLISPDERYVQSYSRKVKEVILAVEITRRYPGKEGKDKILEWYLNYIYYGNFAYGVEAAAQVYFGKSITEVNLAEAAMLAALPQYPGLNPIDNPETAKRRQRLVLDAMVETGYITQAEADQAYAQELVIRPSLETRFQAGEAPHFSIWVRKQLEKEFGPDLVYGGGLRVYTTLDLDMQHEAERIAREHIKTLQEDPQYDRNVSNASVVIIRPRTGEILAMVGSLDYNNDEIDGQINMALSPRQPGSSFKPFTYLTLLSQGYTASQMILDVRTSFPDPPGPDYVPENYDRRYHGPVRVREALANSYNIPAVWALSKAGVKNVIDLAHRMGITTLRGDQYGLSLTLGGGEVTLLDMTYAFSVMANNGAMIGEPVPEEEMEPGFRELNPVAILRVEDRRGNVLKAYEKPEARQILPPALAYLMTDILSDNQARLPAFGVNNKLHLEDRPAAAKSGTTDDWRDAWTIGYTPQYVTGVWVGNADNSQMDHVPGSSGAAPIWQAVMEYLHKDEPVEEFIRPPGLVEAPVCEISGLLPNDHCPNRITELFIEGTQPTQGCSVHQLFRVNKETNKLATVYTPPELVEERVYAIYPPEAADWVRENDLPQPPKVYDDAYGPAPATGDVAIIEPAPYSYISGGATIVGNAKGPNFNMWRLEFGAGLNPSSWSQIGTDRFDQVDNAPLQFWDVSGLEDGLYTLQLRVVRHDGGVQDASVQVTVDNTPPTVMLEHPQEGDTYVMEDDEWVNIQVDASDNIYMDRVEFYMDGALFSTSTVAPFNAKWTITMSQSHGGTETHVIHVVAYDGAGNKAESEKVRISVKHKAKEE